MTTSLAVGTLLLLAMLGRAQAQDPAAGDALPGVKTARDADAVFGDLTSAAYSGVLQIGDRRAPLELHWLEASYSSYDIEQSRGRLAGQAEIAAILRISDLCVELIGQRMHQTEVLLIDIDLLIDQEHVGLSRTDLAKVLKQRTDADGATIKSGKAVHFSLPDRSQVTVRLSPEKLPEVASGQKLAADLSNRESDKGFVRRSTRVGQFVGEMEGKTVYFRLDELGFELDSKEDQYADCATIALAAARNRDRRLDGPVAPGCPWPSRAAFVRTLQDLERADVRWHTGQFNEAAAAMIEGATGVRLTKEQFFQHINATFGDLTRAQDACCPFAEIRHMPLVQKPSAEGQRFIGAVWRRQVESDETLALDIVPRVTLAHRDDDPIEVHFGVIHVPSGNVLGDNTLFLHRLPPDIAATTAPAN